MTPHTSTETITDAVCSRFGVGSGLSIAQLEAEIESLGFQAARIELWNAEPGTPAWMRRMDAERVAKLRDTQAELLRELADKKLRERDSIMENLPQVNVGVAKPGLFRSWRHAILKVGYVIALGGASWCVVYALGELLLAGWRAI